MLTPQDAFKYGFLARCVEEGLSPDQMLANVKLASDLIEKNAFLGTLLGKGFDTAKGLLGGAAQYGVPAALVAPPVLGGLAGYGLAKATDIDDTDVAEIKNQELLDEYQRQIEKMHRDKANRAHRNEKPVKVRPLL